MAELQKPKYIGASRLNTGSAKAAKISMPNISLQQTFKPTHKMQMAKIVAEGTLNIIDAYEAAEMTAIRLELAEEETLLLKHIGEQKRKVTSNLITARPNQLLPKDLEDNFITDGHKIGEDTITPYVVSPEISDKAKELIKPRIDAANNSFNIDTQNVFTKELVDRSKIAIKNRRNKELNSFQNYMTHITREGVEKPTGLYEPNKNQVAEYTAKQYEAFLQTEIEHKNLNKEQADLMLYELKEELAGTILSRHMAQNPTEALEQYTKRPYMVGGVPVDSARVAKNIDSLIRSKENKRIADESNAYEIRMLSYARNKPREVLDEFTDDINEENHQIMLSRIASDNYEGYDIDEVLKSQEDKRQYIPNYLKLKDNPHLTKVILEKMVATAVIGEKALEDIRQRKMYNLWAVELESALYSPTLQYSEHYKVQNYKWIDGKGWRPKPEAITEIARTYGVGDIEVKTAMIKAISRHKTNVKPGSGMIGGHTAFVIFQEELLQFWNDKIFEDKGIEDAEAKAKREGLLKEPYIQNPLDLSPGKQYYQQMNIVQRYTINAMVADLTNLTEDYRNTKKMSLPDMMKTYDFWEDRFVNKDGTYEIQGKVWENIKNVRWNLRLKDLQEIPKATAADDLGLLDKMLQIPHVELDYDEKTLYINRLIFLDGRSGIIWKHGTIRNHPDNFVVNRVWENIEEKHAIFKARKIKEKEARLAAKLNK